MAKICHILFLKHSLQNDFSVYYATLKETHYYRFRKQVTMEEFVESWIMHKIGGEARTDLADSDQKWEQLHCKLQEHDPKKLLADHQLLFRIHTTNQKEPQREDYDDAA